MLILSLLKGYSAEGDIKRLRKKRVRGSGEVKFAWVVLQEVC